MLRSRVLLAAAVLTLLPAASQADPMLFGVTPLVADQPGVSDSLGFGPAHNIDSQLVNAWGVSFPPGGPFWVSDNGTGVSTLYNGQGVKQGLVVSMSGNTAANPIPITGQVFNNTSSFNGNFFLFAGENGGIYGWRGALGTTAETLKSPSNNDVLRRQHRLADDALRPDHPGGFRAVRRAEPGRQDLRHLRDAGWGQARRRARRGQRLRGHV
jgi:hypothetical protein